LKKLEHQILWKMHHIHSMFVKNTLTKLDQFQRRFFGINRKK